MSEPIRTGRVHGRERGAFAGAAVLVACATAAAAMLTTGAEARSTATPVNNTPPVITGVAAVDETLSASTGAWTGATDFVFAWLRCNEFGAACSPIAGATTSTYALVAADAGTTIKVRVTASNADGATEALSEQTAVVTDDPLNTGEPVISGSPIEGTTLSTSNGTWTSAAQLTYTYRWVRCGPDGGLPDGSDCPVIAGAASSSYVLATDDIGKRLRAQVTATNAAGATTSTSNPTALVTQSTTSGPPRNVVEPSISGTFAAGRILVASVGSWAGATPLSYGYQWVRCGADGGNPDGSNCTSISGATSSSYTLTVDDVGARIRIRISASNSLGAQTAASNASPEVTATSTTTPAAQAPRNSLLPAILGSTTVGSTLTSSVGLWTGTAPLLYSYQWLRCGADGGQSTGAGCTAISGATGTQYALVSADLAGRLRVQVTARNTLGTTTATSNATAQVQAAGSTPPPPPPPTGTLPPGAIRLPNGDVSIPVTSVSAPERLVVGEVEFTPNPVRSRQRPLELRVRVVDTRGYVVRDALVFVRSTPLLTSQPGEQRSGRDGRVRLRMRPTANFPLNDDRNVQFFVRVRKASDLLLAGVSNRRIVQVATAG